MSGPTQDFGADQAVTEQLKFSVAGIPGFPGKFEIDFHDVDAITDGFDTFETVDGQTHSTGRQRTGREIKARIYANQKLAVGALDAWMATSRAGQPAHKCTVIATYIFADGSPARALRLTRIFPCMRVDPKTGDSGAAVIEYTFKYHRAEPML